MSFGSCGSPYLEYELQDKNEIKIGHRAASGYYSKESVPITRKHVSEPGDVTEDDGISDVDQSLSTDEGELKSDEESEFNEDRSSEEGEVLSELEELELTTERSPAREETPWERGLRLARERMERAKALKATEKNLAEKRMNLSVPTLAADDELDRASREDVLWPRYYQAFISGRTELTGHRFLMEDLEPPDAEETAKWRESLNIGRHGRRRQRGSGRRATSRSSSSVGSSSSERSSRSYSRHSCSPTSSLASVALSWKAYCAQAMKEYLSSPVGGKGRHGRHGSHSSDSNSRYSYSGSERSQNRPRRHGYGDNYTAATGAGLCGPGGRHMWEAGGHRGKRSPSGSSSSRSGSQSSTRSGSDARRSGRRGSRSASSTHRRRDVPPLPHERPVKRPWMAAPGVGANANSDLTSKAAELRSGDRSRSSSRSRSGSPVPIDEKRFITSWSRSPSSGEERAGRDSLRRERLPDVVPAARVRRGITPARRKKSRSPFANDASSQLAKTPSLPTPVSVVASATRLLPASIEASAKQVELPPVIVDTINTQPVQDKLEVSHEPVSATSSQTAPSGGELPAASNRPGVRLTLAPRIKAPVIGMSSLAAGAPRATTSRSFQPSPPPSQRHPHLPLPQSNRSLSPTGPPAPPLTQTQVRLQAEAAAAALEARERRRAAAEAAYRRRHPGRHKHEDLSKIPVRGRPTYRRQSFSDSSESSRTSASSGSSSRSTSGSRSVSPPTPAVHPDSQLKMQPSSEDVVQQTRTSRHAMRHAPIGMPNRAEPVISYDSYGRQPPGQSDFLRPGSGDYYQMGERTARGQGHKSEYESGRKTHRSSAVIGMNEFKQPYGFNSGNLNDYGPGSTRHKEPKIGLDNTSSRHERLYEDSTNRYPSNQLASRRPMAVPENAERPVRIRTPHGNTGEGFDLGRRSPHSYAPDFSQQPVRSGRTYNSRKEEREIDLIPDIPSRKRLCLEENKIDNITIAANMRRARSRHRSRVPIDRSEPFESDAGGFAAEQRLRELRERLNLVDDAIAEIKAGSFGQPSSAFNESRR
ncbi:unnamed protein product [Calicophoron daubneyi]|uniref:Serine/arginine repetitive matrix protein 2 n=1 Tax=Calicophoron daubneyi TaxID=300641 RepID=A0AAV2TKW7_CALDB